MKKVNNDIKKKHVTVAVITFILLAIIGLYIAFKPYIQEYAKYHLEPSDAFIEQISRLYENPDYCTVIDEKGDDISKSFYANTIKFYENKDFKEIHQYFIDVGGSRIESNPSMYQ